MSPRLINGIVFLVIYLVFLAWYGGWGKVALTEAEVDSLIANMNAHNVDPALIERISQFGYEDDGNEFFMLNLNRYEYAEGEDQNGVPATYQDYGQAVFPMLIRNAGHPIYSGAFPAYLLVGELSGDAWDEVFLVRYRSRRDFVEMVTSDEYQAILEHRTGGIDYAEVTPTSSNINLFTPRITILILLLVIASGIDQVIRRLAR